MSAELPTTIPEVLKSYTFEARGNEGPFFYIDIMPPPEIPKEAKMQKTSEINLDEVSFGTVIYLPPYDSTTGETGHPDSMYTLQIVNAEEQRLVRMWREYWGDFKSDERRKECTGQGLVTTLDIFRDEILDGRASIKTGITAYIPHFYENQGPIIDIPNLGEVSCIKPENNTGNCRMIKTGDIYYYSPESN